MELTSGFYIQQRIIGIWDNTTSFTLFLCPCNISPLLSLLPFLASLSYLGYQTLFPNTSSLHSHSVRSHSLYICNFLEHQMEKKKIYIRCQHVEVEVILQRVKKWMSDKQIKRILNTLQSNFNFQATDNSPEVSCKRKGNEQHEGWAVFREDG